MGMISLNIVTISLQWCKNSCTWFNFILLPDFATSFKSHFSSPEVPLLCAVLLSGHVIHSKAFIQFKSQMFSAEHRTKHSALSLLMVSSALANITQLPSEGRWKFSLGEKKKIKKLRWVTYCICLLQRWHDFPRLNCSQSLQHFGHGHPSAEVEHTFIYAVT